MEENNELDGMLESVDGFIEHIDSGLASLDELLDTQTVVSDTYEKDDQQISAEARRLMQVNLKSIRTRLGMEGLETVISQTEMSKQTALEGLQEMIESIWNRIKQFMAAIMRFIKKIIAHVAGGVDHLKERAAKLLKRIKTGEGVSTESDHADTENSKRHVVAHAFSSHGTTDGQVVIKLLSEQDQVISAYLGFLDEVTKLSTDVTHHLQSGANKEAEEKLKMTEDYGQKVETAIKKLTTPLQFTYVDDKSKMESHPIPFLKAVKLNTEGGKISAASTFSFGEASDAKPTEAAKVADLNEKRRQFIVESVLEYLEEYKHHFVKFEELVEHFGKLLSDIEHVGEKIVGQSENTQVDKQVLTRLNGIVATQNNAFHTFFRVLANAKNSYSAALTYCEIGIA